MDFFPAIFIADLSVYTKLIEGADKWNNANPKSPKDLPIHANVLVAESFLSFGMQRNTLRGKLVCNFHDPVGEIIVIPQTSVQPKTYRLSATLVARRINPISAAVVQKSRLNANRPGVVVFDITEEMAASGEQSLEIRTKDSPNESIEVFVFPAAGNGCIDLEIRNQSISKCVSVQQLANCLSSQKISDIVSDSMPRSMRLTVTSEGRVVLSRWSALPLSQGLWFVLLMPHHSVDGFVNYELSMSGARPRPSLALCALAMCGIPLVVILAFQAVDLFLKRTWHARRGSPCARRPVTAIRFLREWCLLDADFRLFLWQMADQGVRHGSHAAVICLASGCFFLAAIQMAMGLWAGQQRAGSLDICRYNFECYVPFGLDLPFNNMLSHIPYLISGILSIIIVTHTDYNLTLQSEIEGEPRPPDLRLFYALSWCLLLEGFGSSCYHLCPTSYQFQFDSAMMFVIALLSTVCLLDGDESTESDQGSGSIGSSRVDRMDSGRYSSNASKSLFTPVVLMLLITVPMWTISFVGTWFDFVVPVSAQGALSYNVYCAAVLLWFVFILLKEPWALPRYPAFLCMISRASQRLLVPFVSELLELCSLSTFTISRT